MTLYRNQRGATLVHVAMMLLGIMGFTTFVVDYGVLWVSRRQIQNVADAAAHAGAVSLALDSFQDHTSNGPAYMAAVEAARRNSVWGETIPDSAIAIDFWCPDASSTCIRVRVYRDAAHGNPLPTIFGRLVGYQEQGVRASAIAKVFATEEADCLKPWAVIDRWDERYPAPPWGATSQFDKYDADGEVRTDIPAVPGPDEYAGGNYGFDLYDESAGYTPDYGTPLLLRMGEVNKLRAGGFQPLILDETSEDSYRDFVKGCTDTVYKVGDVLSVQDFEPSVNDEAVYTDADSICLSDPDAYWGDPDGDGIDAPVNSNGKRVVQVPLFAPDDVALTKTMEIKAIMGFFISCPGDSSPPAVGPGEVYGWIVQATGSNSGVDGDPGSNPLNRSGLVTVALIR
jgi:Flp pilus assembly protein TadG